MATRAIGSRNQETGSLAPLRKCQHVPADWRLRSCCVQQDDWRRWPARLARSLAVTSRSRSCSDASSERLASHLFALPGAGLPPVPGWTAAMTSES